MSSGLEYRILGPLEVLREGRRVAIPSAKQRIVLATLLLKANQVVDVDELIDRLWPADMPSGARGTAQAYVMRLRRILGEPTGAHDVIRTEQHGYLLTVGPGALDLTGFRDGLRRADQANREHDPAAEAAHLRAALSLWRGRPLSDVPSDSLRRDEVPGLEEQRLQALERRVQIDLDTGRHHQVIAELRSLTSEHPLREGFWAQLMLALYRDGRPADALDAYRRLTTMLSEELAAEPAVQVQRLHLAIQSDDPVLTATQLPPPGRPRSLPPDVPDFVGRKDEIAFVGELLARQRPGTLRLVVLSGPPGVGKTALAVHIAHQVRTDFPDGCLHVNLLGYATSPTMTLRRALTQLLRALGIRPEQVPTETDEQLDLYQSLLVGKQVLVILDNAIGPDQVRPLLPADPGCAVLVTSRNELRGLIALQSARRVALEPLSGTDARQLLSQIVGADLVAAEPEAGDELLRWCGRLPLAVRIAATNLFSRRGVSLDSYVSELRQANRLSALSIDDDEEAAVRTAFGLSYETLGPEARQLFRLLGLVPGPDFTAEAAAALTGAPLAVAATLLDRLAAVSLIQHRGPGRYQFHDLLRLYARERLHLEDSAAQRTEALNRLYGFYLSAADAAAGTLDSTLPRLPRPAWAIGPGGSAPADHRAAVRWLSGERSSLVAAVERAAADDQLAPMSWQLAEALAGYLHRNRYDRDLLDTATTALAAARRHGDPRAEATMLNALGVLHWSAGDYPRALDHLQHSLDLYRAADDTVGISVTLTNLGVVYLEDGRIPDAIQRFTEALAASRRAGAVPSAAAASVKLGIAHLEMGEVDVARSHLDQALAACRDTSMLHTEATALNTLGAVHLRHGELDQAVRCHQEALERYRQLGSRHDQAEVLQNLAAVQRDAHRFTSAVEYGEQALELARQTRNVRFEADTLNTLATARNGLGDRQVALAQHGEALDLARRVGYRQGEITALIGLASTRTGLGMATAAVPDAREAVELARSTGFRLREAQALTVLAGAELALGQRDSAAALAEQALRLHREAGNLLGQARCRYLLGLLADEDPVAAREHLAAALEIHQRLGTGEADVIRPLLAGLR